MPPPAQTEAGRPYDDGMIKEASSVYGKDSPGRLP